ncbi:MAG: leucyl aminopeptidase family protein [Alphaproteobacteria bacterium]
MTSFPLTDAETLGLVAHDQAARPLGVMTVDGFDRWIKDADKATRDWVAASGFVAKAGKTLLLPPADGGDGGAIAVMDAEMPLWDAARVASSLPAASWQIKDADADGIDLGLICLGWALSQYNFDTYRPGDAAETRRLVFPASLTEAERSRITGLAIGTALCRDLINAPANHMTPAGIEAAARDLAARFGAAIEVTSGAALEKDFPAINTVGRAAEVGPRLIDMRWGDGGPSVTLIGKGISFDSGGLDLKPSKAMEIMKKDMGGAATVLGLAAALMTADTPVRLRVLVPTAENAVSAKSMRPLDVIDTRAGIPVEVGNTDAEGRLVLADAITLACEEEPDFMIDFATLTGAARVALGTELPALFANDDETAAQIIKASNDAADPLWRLPLFDAYERHLDGGHAAMSSTGASGYGGAITAALFLRRFAGKQTNWAHIDVMAWNLGGRPGRPKGGEAMGLRALFTYIERLASR